MLLVVAGYAVGHFFLEFVFCLALSDAAELQGIKELLLLGGSRVFLGAPFKLVTSMTTGVFHIFTIT